MLFVVTPTVVSTNTVSAEVVVSCVDPSGLVFRGQEGTMAPITPASHPPPKTDPGRARAISVKSTAVYTVARYGGATVGGEPS